MSHAATPSIEKDVTRASAAPSGHGALPATAQMFGMTQHVQIFSLLDHDDDNGLLDLLDLLD